MGIGLGLSIQISVIFALTCFYQHLQFVQGLSPQLNNAHGEIAHNSRSNLGKRSVRNYVLQSSLSENFNNEQPLFRKTDGESDPVGIGSHAIKRRSAEVPEPGEANFIDGEEEKRRAFIGKRNNFEEDKRRAFIGKRDEIEEEKRRAFIGKRDEFEEEKRRAFIGKRDSMEDDKRRAYIGKREYSDVEKRRAFIGKRGSLDNDIEDLDLEPMESISDTYEKRRAFIGKRDSFGLEKRRSFIGKRLSNTEENLLNYLQYKNRQMDRRRNFIGKRIAEEIFKRRAFIGKRDSEKRRAFIGKRSMEDLDLSEFDSMSMIPFDKRRAFIGKRNPDDLDEGSSYEETDDGFDLNNEEKRRAFIGKRTSLFIEPLANDLSLIEKGDSGEIDTEKRRAFIG